MNAKVIGIGAAGNKAAIELIKENVVKENDVLLLNSTLRDVPVEYKSMAESFSNNEGGCGKERSIAKDLILKSLQEGNIKLDSLFTQEDDIAIIVSSSEGGSGSGASTIVSKYISEVIKLPVIIVVFTGFEEDARGLSNTVEYFKELTDKVAVIAISNKKFLDSANGNKLKAEKLANIEFAEKIRTVLGQHIVDSEQNIDETDLKKLITTPGLMVVEYREVSKIKNVQKFNEICTDIIDTSKSLDYDPTSKRLGVILNIQEKTKDFVDWSFYVFKDRSGHPFELYTHVQSEDSPEFISIIGSGIKLPIDEIKSIYDTYMKETEKVDKNNDSFFKNANELNKMSEDSMFDSKVNKTKEISEEAKNSFFSQFNKSTPKEKVSKFKNVVITRTITDKDIVIDDKGITKKDV